MGVICYSSTLVTEAAHQTGLGVSHESNINSAGSSALAGHFPNKINKLQEKTATPKKT